MSTTIDENISKILDVFSKSQKDVAIVKKAFDFARSLHKNQMRADGLPYISHPVEVALILAELGFDADVVCAGLLHDVVEDCGYTIKETQQQFNANIAQLVDCVSAIDKTEYKFDENELYEDPEFLKASMEEQTFKKLIAIGKVNPLGFCIKFADRLHNLRTIGCFDYAKQLEKVRETEKWIIPIAKILQSEYFYREIKNECFKIVNKFKSHDYLDHFATYHHTNKSNFEKIIIRFKEAFSASKFTTISGTEVKEYKVFEDLCKIIPGLDIQDVSQGQILKVANYNIYLLYEGEGNKNTIGDAISILNKKLSKYLKIIDAKIGSFTKKAYFELEDQNKNKYNLYVMSNDEHARVMLGTLDGRYTELLSDDNINDLQKDIIKVKTRSGETVYVQKGSTVLDFAFKLHRDLGFGFVYAVINGSKTKFPPFTKLNEGDVIEIKVEREENDQIKNVAQLKWLAYVNTDSAKKVLIKHFEKKFKN